MSESLDVAAVQARLRSFAAARDWEKYHDPKSLAGAVCIEAAELLECFQWLSTDEAKRTVENAELRNAVGDEIADVLIYVLRLADILDIDVSRAVTDKIDRNDERFPTAGASVQLSRRR